MRVPLNSAEKKRLAAQANRLASSVTVAGGELTEAAIAHVRAALSSHPLVKVRIQTDDKREVDAAARQLAERVPCELIRRIGRVVVVHCIENGTAR